MKKSNWLNAGNELAKAAKKCAETFTELARITREMEARERQVYPSVDRVHPFAIYFKPNTSLRKRYKRGR